MQFRCKTWWCNGTYEFDDSSFFFLFFFVVLYEKVVETEKFICLYLENYRK